MTEEAMNNEQNQASERDEAASVQETSGAEQTPDESAQVAKPDSAEPQDEKSDKDEAPAEPKPITAENFTVPEGMTLDAGAMQNFLPVASDLGLNQEQAQKLVDIYAQQMQASKTHFEGQLPELINTHLTKQSDAWAAEAKAHEVIGGDKLEAHIENANKAVNALLGDQSKDYIELLKTTGMGNHPLHILALSKIGEKVSGETNLVMESSAGGGDVTEAQAFYGRK